MSWVWLDRAALLAAHAEHLAEHGGRPGLADEGLLDFTLDRPAQSTVFGDPDVFDLAAAYGFGLARSHPFAAGNDRIAAIAAEGFLRLNGSRLSVADAEFVLAIADLAAGELEEGAFAAWLRANAQPA